MDDVIVFIILYQLLMGEHSKIANTASNQLLEILRNAFLGSREKKAFSAVLLAIIGYLIYIKNKKTVN